MEHKMWINQLFQWDKSSVTSTNIKDRYTL
jgi:hypothetical protein